MKRLARLVGYPREDLFRLAERSARYYRSFDIRFHGSDKWRHIDTPADSLKEFQKRLADEVLSSITLPSTMLGSVSGCSIQDNMDLHIGTPCLATIDLRDCFPRTGPKRVFRTYREVLGCSPEIAGLLTRLTTFQHRLPQGAPTSSMLANLTLLSLHAELAEIARRRGLGFSVWVDDIAFSGDPEQVRQVVGEAIGAIGRHGHAVRCKKVIVMPAHRSQKLTGGILNRGRSAGRTRIQDIRDRLFCLAASELPSPNGVRRVLGQIQFVARCSESQGRKLRRLADSLLPAPGKPEKRGKKYEFRRCRSACRHRRQGEGG